MMLCAFKQLYSHMTFKSKKYNSLPVIIISEFIIFYVARSSFVYE